MEKILSAAEVRVLGSLIEKQISTPEYYPLTLNALVSACNQKSNRHPVVAYSDEIVQSALDRLREKKLSRVIFEGNGRVPKYGHIFTTAFSLDQEEVAVLCVLMLRGPQTVGEIRGRTGRLHEFTSLSEVEETLQGLMEREAGSLVTVLNRQAGLKEPRYAHLLAGEPVVEESVDEAASAVGSPGTQAAMAALEREVQALRQELGELRQQFCEFKKQFE